MQPLEATETLPQADLMVRSEGTGWGRAHGEG